MSEWKENRLGKVAPFKYGKALTSEKRTHGEFNVFSSAGICGKSEIYLAKQGIIIGRKGSVGTVYYSDKPFFCIDTAFYIDNIDSQYNMKFLYYYIKLLHLESYNNDAAVPGLNRNLAEKLKISCPDLTTQNRIANILSTYDDLIENNNKRIKILEQMAENLYKEWFVRFRFPGYENAEFENGIPKGWEIVKLGDYVEIKGGKRLPEGKSLCAKKTEHPYIRIRDIAFTKFVSLNNCFEYIDNETFETLNRFTVNTNDILISIVGTIGSIACVGKSLNGANLTENCVKLVNIDYFTNDFLYHFLNSDAGKGAIQAGVVGATQPKLPIYNIKKIKLLKPKINLINLFTNIIEPINHEIMMLMDSNQYIIKQRDLLLPRLMSGKLEVE